MHPSIAETLWLASFIGNVVVLCILIGKARYRLLPFFTALVSFSVLRTAVLFVVRRIAVRDQYFYTYWSFAALDLLLQSGVVYEIAARVFKPAGRWARDTWKELTLLVFGGTLLALVLTALSVQTLPERLEIAIIKGSFFVSVLMTELFVGMLLLSVRAGLPWQSHVASVAYAFGAYSLIDVILEAAHNLFGRFYMTAIDVHLANARAFVYVCCLVYWSVALWRDASVKTEQTGDATDAAAMWASIISENTAVKAKDGRS